MAATSQNQPLALAGKVAIVTGGSRGIGAATAIELAKRGANVAITFVSDSSAKLADEVIANIAKLDTGTRAIKIQADARDLSSPEKIIKETTAAFGNTIDILVNNAGAEFVVQIGKFTHDKFAHAFEINVRSVAFTTQAVLPHLPASGGGRIVNIGSTLGRIGHPGGSLYSATKAAVEGLTRGWAHDLGAQGHTVNVVSPAMTDTDMIKRSMEKLGMGPQMLEMQKMMTPFEHRLAQPEDIALVVAMLAEPSSRWVTGQTIQAGGGIYLS